MEDSPADDEETSEISEYSPISPDSDVNDLQQFLNHTNFFDIDNISSVANNIRNLRDINYQPSLLPVPKINILQDHISSEKIHLKSERKKKRRHEKLRFQDFFNTLKDDTPYEANKLTEIYNKFFQTNDDTKISSNSLGHMNEIKEHFKKKHKYYNSFQKVTLYFKKDD